MITKLISTMKQVLVWHGELKDSSKLTLKNRCKTNKF
jgi:hypothetical protein